MTGLETISRPLPGFAAIERLADATGIMQHSRHSIPDPEHGYCVDDNARALILMHRRPELPEALHDRWAEVFANFVERAWNPERAGFRNFMSYDGAWLEEAGAEDSQGRALWSLGITAAEAASPAQRAWALDLFEEAAGPLLALGSPRAQAFCILGATALLGAMPGQREATAIVERFAPRLSRLVSAYARPGWAWFEPVLAYDNARLPEALLRAGHVTGERDFVDMGIETLGWLAALQTAEEGHFRAVGCESFGRAYAPPARWDQQPLEAQGMIEACEAAFAATGEARWLAEAERAFAWFLGANDGGVALADAESGECYDGLTPTGPNLNRGAESVLAFQLGACAMIGLRDQARR
ncbi:MAG TPA: hypothetical protein VLK25_13110 [Allosphingosinicella sp.]|nr:hypothetical protein [Allosphingosinicella sp.]